MPPVYVSQQGAQVRTKNGRLLVTLRDERLLDLPLEQVDQLTVFGRGVQVSTGAMVELVERGAEVAFLSQGGRFFGKITGRLGGAAHLRLAQAAWASDEARSLAVARLVVAAKLGNQVLLLRRLGAEGRVEQVARLRAEADRAPTADYLRGLEGAAATAYFRTLAEILPGELGFRGRAYHPPPDPVNATLGFGYTLLLNEAIGRINVVGLDPYIGFLHVLEPSRPSFGLDMEEELRPAIDDLVVGLFRRGELRLADFSRGAEGIRLVPEARKRFLLAYEGRLSARVSHPMAHGRVQLRQAIELQVRQWGRLLLGEQTDLEPVRLGEIL